MRLIRKAVFKPWCCEIAHTTCNFIIVLELKAHGGSHTMGFSPYLLDWWTPGLMNAVQSLFLWIYNSLYRCITCRLLNYSILAKPWIFIYYFAVVCLLIDETPPSVPPLPVSFSGGPPVSQPTGARALVITFWREARHNHYVSRLL